MFENLRADMKRYAPLGGWTRNLGFWIGATYRFGHWADGLQNRPLRLALLAGHRAAATPWRFFKQVNIPARATIGPGFCLQHPRNIVLPPGVQIGEHCTMSRDVTIGQGPAPGVPRLGAGVVVLAGARVLGGVQVGDAVEIGPDAVVARDVGAGSTVCKGLARVNAPEAGSLRRPVTRPPVRVLARRPLPVSTGSGLV